MRWHLFAGLATMALLADQATKAMALAWLAPGVPLAVFRGFDLVLGFNTGASFGMMSGPMAGKPLLMAALTGALTLFVAWLGLRAKSAPEAAGYALISGGAVGNIVDRLRHGAVTDFLDFYWRDWHWPTFNGADIAIFLGAVLIVVTGIRPSSRERAHT